MEKNCRITLAVILLTLSFADFSCDIVELPDNSPSTAVDSLSLSEVRLITGQAVQQAQRLNKRVTVVIVDREGNELGVFLMTGSADSTVSALRKARTATYLSSNGHAFTTLTACFITRDHFPPGVSNTAGGPLYGVGFSSLPGGDIQPNPGPLSDEPGGVPIYKNGVLAGGIGVSGAGNGFTKNICSGTTDDEIIALGAVLGFAAQRDKRGDNILIDGVRFLYSTLPSPQANYQQGFVETSFGSYTIGPLNGGSPLYPIGAGYVVNLAPGFSFPARAGSLLTQSDVERIIQHAAGQAARTRAAIRQPPGKASQVFIAVVDIDGSPLGIWRTPDATVFSFDVSAQKARTALAFSNPADSLFGIRFRQILQTVPPGAPLAVTTRAVGFLSQRYFPPGIDENTIGHPLEQGPLYEGSGFAYQLRLFSDVSLRVGGRLPAYGNGITIFPGGIPLYKNGQLAGAIGISGDGVDQDDLIAAAGTAGFEPPADIRCDQYFYHGIRLPYVKFPRNPGL